MELPTVPRERESANDNSPRTAGTFDLVDGQLRLPSGITPACPADTGTAVGDHRRMSMPAVQWSEAEERIAHLARTRRGRHRDKALASYRRTRALKFGPAA